MAKHADSDDEDSFVEIAERKVKVTTTAGKKEVVRTAVPPSMADVSNADTTVSECPVCTTSMPDALVTPCGHVFCKRVRIPLPSHGSPSHHFLIVHPLMVKEAIKLSAMSRAMHPIRPYR